ncbi:MAG: hypothetical protein ACLPWS_14070 [Rhodomicrobium sp.]
MPERPRHRSALSLRPFPAIARFPRSQKLLLTDRIQSTASIDVMLLAPRIDNREARAVEVRRVAGGERQAAGARNRCDLGVETADRPPGFPACGSNPGVNLCGGGVEGENAPGKQAEDALGCGFEFLFAAPFGGWRCPAEPPLRSRPW